MRTFMFLVCHASLDRDNSRELWLEVQVWRAANTRLTRRPTSPMPPVKRIIIDTDIGVDDSICIIMALRSPELELLGLTTV